jgi:hypothetical protein
MYTTHAGYSFVAKIVPGREQKVIDTLTALNSNTGENDKLPLSKCGTTLFVSSLVIPAQDYHGETLPASLLFLSTYSGPFKTHLKELVTNCKEGLHDLFINCNDFPEEALTNDAALSRYMKKHRYPDTFYSGMQYITHADIAREDELRTFIESIIDQEQTKSEFYKLSGIELRSKIQEAVKNEQRFHWTQKVWKRTFADWWALYGSLSKFLFVFVIALLGSSYGFAKLMHSSYIVGLAVSLGLMVAFSAFIILSFRLNEKQQHFVAPRQPDEKVRKIFETQTYPVINKMIVGGPLKKGWIRPVFQFIVLRLASIARGFLYIPTVASARWLRMDGGKRFIFNSNFGNLSESYVRDFIDSKKRARSINLIYGQGDGYPLTKWARNDGAITNPEGFINDVHLMDHPIQLWYWPYQHLSIDNIINNRKIYLGLNGNMNEKDSINWLKLL